MEEQPFIIEWSIGAPQWDAARKTVAMHGPQSDYDRRSSGRYYLLYGDVDFAYAGTRLYGRTYGIKGINVSLMDLCLALAEAYMTDGFTNGSDVSYEQLDDDLKIRFITQEGEVHVVANDRSCELRVPRDAFLRGVTAFLCGFAAACTREVATILAWDSMRGLREFSALHCDN